MLVHVSTLAQSLSTTPYAKTTRSTGKSFGQSTFWRPGAALRMSDGPRFLSIPWTSFYRAPSLTSLPLSKPVRTACTPSLSA